MGRKLGVTKILFAVVFVTFCLVSLAELACAEGGPFWLLHGPYLALDPGKYKVTYRLKIGDNGIGTPVATIDVVANKASEQLACINLLGTDFATPDCYQDFNLAIESSGQEDFEFRLSYCNISSLWVDKVSLIERGKSGGVEVIEAEDPRFGHQVGSLVLDKKASGGQAWAVGAPPPGEIRMRPRIYACVFFCFCLAIAVWSVITSRRFLNRVQIFDS